jgi:hypothetical protein
MMYASTYLGRYSIARSPETDREKWRVYDTYARQKSAYVCVEKNNDNNDNTTNDNHNDNSSDDGDNNRSRHDS